MTNYTKTTDFAAKDALPSGNSAKIVKGSEIDTEFNNIATASATKANANSAALTGTTTFETISDGTIAITAFVDEDNMASDSATLLPTQQSVKAYVDSQVTAQDLDVTDGSTSIDIDLDSESLGILGGTGIDSTASGTGVTLAIDSTVATLTGSQTLSNKTLSTPVVSGNLTTDGLLDGRDVAADGTKLDGIESGATADQTAAEIKTAYESNADTNAFTDADESKLDGIEASADVTDTANVTAAGALMDSELTSEASVKALNQGVATTDSPTFAGLTTTADVSFGDNDKAIFGAGSDLQIYHDGSQSVIYEGGTGPLDIRSNSETFIKNGGGTETLAHFANNGAVTLYYDNAAKLATTSTGIDVTGEITADALTINSSGVQIGTVLQSTSTTSARLALMDANTTAASQVGIGATGNTLGLYAGGGLPKVVVSGTGIDVTGTVTADGLTVDGDGSFAGDFEISGLSPKIFLSETDTTDVNTRIRNAAGKLQIQTVDNSDANPVNRFQIDHATGDISFYEDTGTTPKFFWDASAESLGIGTTNPASLLQLSGSPVATSGALATFRNSDATSSNTTFGGVHFSSSPGTDFSIGKANVNAATSLSFRNGNTGASLMDLTSAGNVGIGSSSPSEKLTIAGDVQIGESSGGEKLKFVGASSKYNFLVGKQVNVDNAFEITPSTAAGGTTFSTPAVVVNSSGNLLVGKTSSSVSSSGLTVSANDFMSYTNTSTDSGDRCLILNRQNGSGNILDFQQANGLVGSIGVSGGNNLYISSMAANHAGLTFATDAILPTRQGSLTDNVTDLGASSERFVDIYATNGTIQTSDRNEKQDIAELSDAEQRVAIAAKGLLRKFRWKDSVAEKGDDARIHFGIIAQDLQDAFAAEGLDAGDYGMFTSTTWTDEETNEEKTRMGVRYSELLAFIISAI